MRERRRGIPYARNTAVAAAGPCDFVLFVDDDEVVDPAWLVELVEVQRAHDADVVTGPVIATYPAGAPRWAQPSGVFERPRRPTGTLLELAATGNTLVRTRVFEALDHWFDEGLAQRGGSDSELFDRVHRAGYTIVWADGALVFEDVATERLELGWVVRRGYRVGIGMAQMIQQHDERSRFVLAAKQVVVAMVEFLACLGLVVRDRPRAVARLSRAARAAGRAAGHVGLSTRRYV